jgi:aspartate/methionine/tyrosine aminotransferase
MPIEGQWERLLSIISKIDATHSVKSVHGILDSARDDVRALLSVPPAVECAVTFSGSIALERTISALVPTDRHTLVTEPGFDSIARFVERSAQRPPLTVRLDPFSSRLERVEEIVRLVDRSVGAVVIVSPDNPSGLALSTPELNRLARACGLVDAVLIVDHCFALVNFAHADLGMAFNLNGICRWAALWDTSKSIELAGEKLGFIFASHSEMAMVKSALNEIQLELPILSLAAVGTAMLELHRGDGIGSYNRLIAANYHSLRAACELIGLKINQPDAGGFALITTEDNELYTSLDMANKLRKEYGIAVVPSEHLYLTDYVSAKGFLRISLARPREKVDRLCAALKTIVDGLGPLLSQ